MRTIGDVKQVYRDCLDERRSKLEAMERHSELLSRLRLLVFVCLVGVLYAVFIGQWMSAVWIGGPVGGFVFLAVRHDRILRRLKRLKWSVDYYRRALDRIEGRWRGQGIATADYVSDDHLYAADLDLFGENSLFELICSPGTRSGEESLAAWLTQSAPREEVLLRQGAVRELTEKVSLRETIFLGTRQMTSLVDPQKLRRWAESPAVWNASRCRRLRRGFTLIGLGSVGAGISCFFWNWGILALLGMAVVCWGVGRWLQADLQAVTVGVQGPRRQLTIVSELLAVFEAQTVVSDRLMRLKGALTAHNTSASQAVARLGKLVDRMDQSKNQIFAPFAFLSMWTGHCVISIERWRADYGRHIVSWLDAEGQLEALCSLSGYAFEHPEDVYPQIVEDDIVLDGEALGHPLIDDSECVRNDVSLNKKEQVWIVSGSNMSGKSTFLRVVGINVVLAMAGAPVRARRLRLTPVAIGSTIRVTDSLAKGASRFYAEISTLKEIVNLGKGTYPLLFLLDEIFHGTNSHDRRIGAHAVVKELVRQGALGLVTTHDLALTDAANEFADKARNVHFDDHVDERGNLVFDYRVKDGRVTRSNALELMRVVGLTVE